MIVKMKKVHIVVQKKDALSAVEALHDLGVVHVDNAQIPRGERISQLKEYQGTLEKVIGFLSQVDKHHQQQELQDWQTTAQEIFGLVSLIEQYHRATAQRQAKIEKWEPWGDFRPLDVEALRHKGVVIRFAEFPKKEIPEVPDGVILDQVFVKGGSAGYAVISREEVELPFRVLGLPDVSLEELRREQATCGKRIKEAERQIRESSAYLDSFQKIFSRVDEELKFQEVYRGKGEEGQLAFLKGFCPVDACHALEEAAGKEQWGLLLEDPSEEEVVPTLLRNPRWVNLIKPVLGMINILPGYREFDISVVFLLFFSVFFGILIGDAGYGLIFMFLTAGAQVKLKNKLTDKKPLFLMYVLSGCTVLWGFLTGTFFGQKWLAGALPPLWPWLADERNFQMLCFLIGASHLSIAHVWRAVLKMPSFAVLGEAGWLSIVWGMYFVAGKLVLGMPFPFFAKILLFGGAGLVVFFTKPRRNPLKAVGTGMGALALNAVNTFTDVVSYIRLFAVGMATVALADATNTMALESGFGTFFAGFLSALILIVGHVLNMILGAMAILVHGLRLNVLEFSSHMNLEWAGIKYKPFKKDT